MIHQPDGMLRRRCGAAVVLLLLLTFGCGQSTAPDLTVGLETATVHVTTASDSGIVGGPSATLAGTATFTTSPIPSFTATTITIVAPIDSTHQLWTTVLCGCDFQVGQYGFTNDPTRVGLGLVYPHVLTGGSPGHEYNFQETGGALQLDSVGPKRLEGHASIDLKGTALDAPDLGEVEMHVDVTFDAGPGS